MKPYQHACSEIKALEELSDEYISRYSRVDIHFFHLFENVDEPLKTSLVTCRPDKIYFMTLDFKPEIEIQNSIIKV